MPMTTKMIKHSERPAPAASRSTNPFSYTLNEEVLTRIWLERLRQRDLFRRGKLSCPVESTTTDENRKLRVLVEEVGEVAQELDALEMITRARTESREKFEARLNKRRRHLQLELTQLAAVTVAWLESFELGNQESRNGGGR